MSTVFSADHPCLLLRLAPLPTPATVALVGAAMISHDPPRPPATVDWSRDEHLTQIGQSEFFPWIFFFPNWNGKNIVTLCDEGTME